MKRWVPERFDADVSTSRGDAEPESVGESIVSLESLQKSAYEEAFVQGYQQGLIEGRERGLQEGKEEGLASGFAQGKDEGRELGIREGLNRIDHLTVELTRVLSELREIPNTLIDGGLAEWVYSTARKLGSDSAAVRSIIEDSVTTLCNSLPVPGKGIYIKASTEDKEIWTHVISNLPESLSVAINFDSEQKSGSAIVTVGDQQIDIGLEAQRALIRNALGLPISSSV